MFFLKKKLSEKINILRISFSKKQDLKQIVKEKFKNLQTKKSAKTHKKKVTSFRHQEKK